MKGLQSRAKLLQFRPGKFLALNETLCTFRRCFSISLPLDVFEMQTPRAPYIQAHKRLSFSRENQSSAEEFDVCLIFFFTSYSEPSRKTKNIKSSVLFRTPNDLLRDTTILVYRNLATVCEIRSPENKIKALCLQKSQCFCFN